jgi:hemolysin activation/secretion protein
MLPATLLALLWLFALPPILAQQAQQTTSGQLFSGQIQPLPATPAPNDGAGGFELPPLPDHLIEETHAGPGFRLQGIEFEGNRVFSDADLTRVVAEWLGRTVNFSALEAMRLRLTNHYTDAGYISSGVLLPNQDVSSGRVRFQVVEGRLSEIRIRGNEGLRQEYIRARLSSDGEALNVARLQQQFQLLLADPAIERLNGKLRPGVQAGDALLDLEVTRARPWDLRLTLDNHRTEGLGELTLGLESQLHNLTGWGDRLSLRLDTSSGVDAWQLGAEVPLGKGDYRLYLGAEQSDSELLKGPIASAGITSEFTSLHAGLDYHLWRSPWRRLTLGAQLSARDSQVWVDGSPFSTAEGVGDDGIANTRILRLIQEYTDRGADHALALRSTFNLGLDLLDATINRDAPDGRYLSWIGQFRITRQFDGLPGQLSAFGAIQLASEPLLPQERFAIGGTDTVRGYPENHRVTDNGAHLTLEYRRPIPRNLWPAALGDLDALLFLDAGKAWNENHWHQFHHLAAIGIGLAWRYKGIEAELYAARARPQPPTSPGVGSLQGDGIHFRIVTSLF